MKRNTQIKSRLQWACILLLVPIVTEAQCELFKSEMEEVRNYMVAVSHQVDSLLTFAESAAYAAQLASGRTNVRKVELMMGKALNAADEAVLRAAEAQYYSEVCGLEAVKSHSIDAERHALDARDFAEEAFANAKAANSAKNLGDMHYYMRKSQHAGQEARDAADDAVYAASIAHLSCTHEAALGLGSE